MYRSFAEIERFLLEKKIRKTIALCGAHDEAALTALINAKRKGLANGILIGNEEGIRALLEKLGEPAEDYQIIHKPIESKAALEAMKRVYSGEADIVMKGIIQTTTFVTAATNPIYGILDEDDDFFLSHTSVFYYPERNQLLLASDTSFTMEPTLEDKVHIINNAAKVARALGYEHINVGVLSAVEVVRNDIPTTLDAKALREMTWAEDLTVSGPFALDNALDEESARHKGIEDPIAGKVDLLLVPDFLYGNALYKSIHFFGHLPTAGVVCGTSVPAVVPSRTDPDEAKFNSILIAILQSLSATK